MLNQAKINLILFLFKNFIFILYQYKKNVTVSSAFYGPFLSPKGSFVIGNNIFLCPKFILTFGGLGLKNKFPFDLDFSCLGGKGKPSSVYFFLSYFGWKNLYVWAKILRFGEEWGFWDSFNFSPSEKFNVDEIIKNYINNISRFILIFNYL